VRRNEPITELGVDLVSGRPSFWRCRVAGPLTPIHRNELGHGAKCGGSAGLRSAGGRRSVTVTETAKQNGALTTQA